MALVTVERVQRRKKIGDKNSPMMYFLKQKKGNAKVYDIKRIASEIEAIGSLSEEDVRHVINSFVRSMKQVLRDGNRVKVDGLGTFFITLTCPGTAKLEDCTVRSIKRVNIRFMVDNTLRLVNDSTATTRAAANNVEFNLYIPPKEKVDDGDEAVDPLAK